MQNQIKTSKNPLLHGIKPQNPLLKLVQTKKLGFLI